MENRKDMQKKSLKWLWIAIALVVVAAVATWCVVAALSIHGTTDKSGANIIGINKALSVPAFLVGIFIVTALGYLLGRITIKGVSLGTAGVFIVAIGFGIVCFFIPENIPVLGSFSFPYFFKSAKPYSKLVLLSSCNSNYYSVDYTQWCGK